MEQVTRQLFTDYILNRCTAAQVETVLQKLRDGGYEEEWVAAMKAAESHLDEQSIKDIYRLQSPLNKPELWQQIKRESGLAKPAAKKMWFAFPAAAVLLIIAGYFFWFQAPLPKEAVTMEQSMVHRPPGNDTAHKWLKLPDGTSVILNSGSLLDYAEDFGKNGKREVTLTGEAFFDVNHDASRAFIIHTGKLTTTVLGTAFNIKAWPNSDSVTVTVARGKVMVQDAMQTLAVLTPAQQLRWVEPGKGNVSRAKVNVDEVLSWKADELIMDDITLEAAAAMIAQRYNLEVKFKNDAVKRCRFTAAFLNRNELSQVLSVVGDITGAIFHIEQHVLYIDGPGCTPL
ncbi:FecR family protein [Pedobacter sp. GR22-6]|uniref:FecR family protein n=1 Tax=Pedobacter sp. GR22-6 TaxID=3127957 RepID=UPI00307D3155